MKKRILSSAIISSMLAAELLAGIFSASSAAAQGKKTHKAYQLETITVTAQKQEEDIQKVPISITQFGPLMLEDRQIDSSLDLMGNVPNLMLYEATGGFIVPSLRGIASTSEAMSTTVMRRISLISKVWKCCVGPREPCTAREPR